MSSLFKAVIMVPRVETFRAESLKAAAAFIKTRMKRANMGLGEDDPKSFVLRIDDIDDSFAQAGAA